jgi:hypothetical protein
MWCLSLERIQVEVVGRRMFVGCVAGVCMTRRGKTGEEQK